MTTGAVDATTFLRLGNVFSSVITGNLVLLGMAAGRRSGTLAISGGLALSGYAAGVLVGAMLAGPLRRDQPIWPRRVTITLAAELAVLACLAGGWLLSDGRPAADARLGLLPLAAAAMGMQSAAIRRLGQLSTTYLTGTLTGLLTALATRRRPAGWHRDTTILFALVIGAATGALTAFRSPGWLPVVILTPLAVVTTASLAIAEP